MTVIKSHIGCKRLDLGFLFCDANKIRVAELIKYVAVSWHLPSCVNSTLLQELQLEVKAAITHTFYLLHVFF